jgi:hypothetical protein
MAIEQPININEAANGLGKFIGFLDEGGNEGILSKLML